MNKLTAKEKMDYAIMVVSVFVGTLTLGIIGLIVTEIR